VFDHRNTVSLEGASGYKKKSNSQKLWTVKDRN